MTPLIRKKLLAASGLIASGIILTAAMVDPGLPAGYWENPEATSPITPHSWPEAERNLHPEACAQCHSEQFNLWKKSLHAHAYSTGLVGQFPGMGYREANNCLTCHAPLQEQRYKSAAEMNRSISLRLKHAEGFDRSGHPDSSLLPLRHTGVSCAVCHVRNWNHFGPPPVTNAVVGHQQTAAHGGFTATRKFEQSQFCASCHQFPQSMAINGKPLENTATEWMQSKFPKQGITCQKCHMPERRHEFRGIHDPKMVRKGVTFHLSRNKNSAILTLTSKWIGHAFPTYVTPMVVIRADAQSGSGRVLREWQWEIVREVEYNNGWQEIRDTRIMPGESRRFVAIPLPVEAVTIRYRVTVIPDHFYKGIYQELLSNSLEEKAKIHIQRAQNHAGKNDYLLFERELPL